jgi:hypothetical protein
VGSGKDVLGRGSSSSPSKRFDPKRAACGSRMRRQTWSGFELRPSLPVPLKPRKHGRFGANDGRRSPHPKPVTLDFVGFVRQVSVTRSPWLWTWMAAAVSIAAAPTSAHAAWSAPQRIVSSDVGQFSQPQVARDAGGDAVIVWEREGRYPSHNQPTVVEAATRRAGGSWSAPVRLASGRPGPGRPEVAMDSRGEVTVVWEQSTFDGKTGKERSSVRLAVEARSHPAGGGWERPVVLASRRQRLQASDEHEPDPQVAVDRRGDVTVAYRMRAPGAKPFNGREDVLLSTRRRGGRWHGSVVVAHTVNSYATQLAVDGRGETILAWDNGGPEGGGEHGDEWVEALVLARDGKPEGRPQALSSKSKHAGEFNLAANYRGGAVLTWSRELAEGEGRGPVEASTRPAGRRFTTKPVTLLRKSYSAIVAIDRQGNATALFERSTRTETEAGGESGPLEAATHPTSGNWSKPQTVSPKSSPYALAYGPHNELMAVWGTEFPPQGPSEHKVAKAIIETSIQPAGGAWQPPVAITPENGNSSSANLALAATGQATAIWLREPSPGEELIETADYEPS